MFTSLLRQTYSTMCIDIVHTCGPTTLCLGLAKINYCSHFNGNKGTCCPCVFRRQQRCTTEDYTVSGFGYTADRNIKKTEVVEK